MLLVHSAPLVSPVTAIVTLAGTPEKVPIDGDAAATAAAQTPNSSTAARMPGDDSTVARSKPAMLICAAKVAGGMAGVVGDGVAGASGLVPGGAPLALAEPVPLRVPLDVRENVAVAEAEPATGRLGETAGVGSGEPVRV